MVGKTTVLPRRVEHADLHRFVVAVMVARGMRPDDAEIFAAALVWADLRGITSHGVVWLDRYCGLVDRRELDAAAQPVLTRDGAAHFVLDAKTALGSVAMMRAAALAVERAAAGAVCVGGVRDMGHSGAIGHYASWMAAQGCASIILVAGPPMMAYPGSRGAALSTSPIAIAVPRASGDTLLLDMATSVITFSRLRLAKTRGETLDTGWAVDAEGRPTTDAQRAETPVPIAGAKGAGLALMVEVLTSLLLDNPIVSEMLDPAGDHHHRQNALLVALRPAAFGDPARFVAAVERLAETIHALPRGTGGDAVRLPGERGAASERELRVTGIPIPPAVWADFERLARETGVGLPQGMAT